MLTQYQTVQLQQVVDIITQCTLPEKIFLLGASYSCHYEDNIFVQHIGATEARRHITQYCLLILTPEENRHTTDELLSMINNRCNNNATPVVLYIEAIHKFNGWLQSGHSFACTVNRQGVLLYDAGKIPLVSPGNIVTMNVSHDLTGRYGHITEFLAGAELYRLRKQFSLAAFLVHQAAEQALIFIIKLITGYRVATHNLEKLFCYARPLLPELEVVFNKQNEKEQNLFKLLQQAYIHSRYSEDYCIKEKELNILIGRIKKLQEITQQVADKWKVSKKATSL
jgi:uncharacterized protein